MADRTPLWVLAAATFAAVGLAFLVPWWVTFAAAWMCLGMVVVVLVAVGARNG